MNLDWLNSVLPLLRCPDTHQPLRWASEGERARLGPPPPAALANEDGTRLFRIEDGSPNLLPQALGQAAIEAGQAAPSD